MELKGLSLVGSASGSAEGVVFRGMNPATGEALDVE